MVKLLTFWILSFFLFLFKAKFRILHSASVLRKKILIFLYFNVSLLDIRVRNRWEHNAYTLQFPNDRFQQSLVYYYLFGHVMKKPAVVLKKNKE
jgi:hypothetical protein